MKYVLLYSLLMCTLYSFGQTKRPKKPVKKNTQVVTVSVIDSTDISRFDYYVSPVRLAVKGDTVILLGKEIQYIKIGDELFRVNRVISLDRVPGKVPPVFPVFISTGTTTSVK